MALAVHPTVPGHVDPVWAYCCFMLCGGKREAACGTVCRVVAAKVAVYDMRPSMYRKRPMCTFSLACECMPYCQGDY